MWLDARTSSASRLAPFLPPTAAPTQPCAHAPQVKECLEEHRNDDGFSADCKEEIVSMIERRVRDFKLDSRLRTACESDIYTTCAFYGVSLTSHFS